MSKIDTHHTYEVIYAPAEKGVRFFTSIDSGSYIPWHWHHAIEIIYMLEGELTVAIENTVFKLYADDCFLVNSGIVHESICTTPNKAIVLQIPIPFIETYVAEVQQLLFSFDLQNQQSVYQTKLQVFKETLIQMQIADDIRPDGFILRFNSLLFELIFQLYHNFSTKVFTTRLSQKNKDFARLDPVLTYTAQHYKEPISIAQIAEIAFLQPGYFCRFFKNCMGITFLEYLNQVRISYIYQDLIRTKDSVLQIIERHGFTNYKLFRRMFFEHFQATPTQIRKRLEK